MVKISAVEIVGGIMIIISAVILLAVVTMQESKGGLGVISGSNESFAKNRVRTVDAMLSMITKIMAIVFAVVTLLVNIVGVLMQ